VLRTPGLHPNPENATLDELHVAMEAAPNKRSYVRLNAIRSLLMGISQSTLCQLSDWLAGGVTRAELLPSRLWCAILHPDARSTNKPENRDERD